jgi:hypothetical protein
MTITRLNPESVAISEQTPITAAEMGNTSVADGCWYLRGVDPKTGHQYGIIPRASGLMLYDYTARATVWMMNASSFEYEYIANASGFIDLAAGISVTSAVFVRFGKIAQLQIRWCSASAITVSAVGNIPNVTIGTLKAGRRPKFRSVWTTAGDDGGPAFGSLNPSGVLELGACEGTGAARTIAAGTYFVTGLTYILE